MLRLGCPDKTASEFMYSDSVKGGFVRSKVVANLVFSVKGGEFVEGAEVSPCQLPSARLYVGFARLFSAPVDPILTLPLRLNSALITDKANGSCSPVSHARSILIT